MVQVLNLLIGWFLFLQPLSTSAPTKISLDSNFLEISIAENSYWLADSGNQWLGTGLASFVESDYFTPYSRNAFVYREIYGPAILRFNINTGNAKAKDFVLELRNTEIDRAQLLIIDKNGKQWESQVIGDIFPFQNRYYPFRTLAFPVELEPNNNYTFFLGMEKQNRILSSIIELYSYSNWSKINAERNLVYGMFFGFFFMVICLAILLYVIMRNRLYIYYGLYVTFMMLLVGCFHGLNYQYLFPDLPGLQQYFMLLVLYFSLIFGNLYSFEFLTGGKLSKSTIKIRSVLISIYCIGLIQTIFHINFSESIAALVNVFFIIIEIANVLILVSIAIWYIVNRRSKAAIVFIVSFLFVGLSVAYTNFSFLTDNLIYIPIGHSLLVGLSLEILVLTTYMILRYRKVETEKLESEKLLVIERLNSQQSYFNGQEEEKRTLALHLHDDLGSSLISVKKQLEEIPQTKHIGEQILQISKEVRNLSHTLLPVTLEQFGLIEATRELIANENTVKFHLAEITKTINPDKEIATQLYRILQELIKNTIKHGEASNVYIQYLSEGDDFQLHYEDDGRGFDINKVKKGVGLIGIRERAAIIDAKIYLDSYPGKGMSASVIVNAKNH